MTKDQIARWNSMTGTQVALAKFEPVYDGTTPATKLAALGKAATELDELLAELSVQARAQKARSGASREKAAVLQGLADAAFEVCNAIQAFASDGGDHELAGQACYTLAELERGADKTIIGRAESIHETASGVVDSLGEFGVTPAKLTALNKKIEAFRKVHPAPRQRVNASSAATKQIRKLFKQARELFRERLDRLMVQYKSSNPAFYNEYKSSRVKVVPASAPVDAAADGGTPLPKAA